MCKKVLGPQGDIVPHLKFKKRTTPWNYDSSKFINTSLILGRGLSYHVSLCHCLTPRKSEFKPFLAK